jgi:dipeptidase
MKKGKIRMKKGFVGMTIFLLMATPVLGWCCTSFVAGKETTVDGSVIAAHNEDLRADTAQRVEVFPGKKFKLGELEFLGSGEALPYVPEKFKVIQFNSGFDPKDYNADNPNFLNPFGVTSWDNAMTPRKELLAIESKSKNLVDSKELKRVPLERTKNAREAVQMLGYLVDTFGFIRPGLAYGIADPNEGWIVEVTQGKHWVAQRVPDDMVVMRANCYRIGEVDLADTKNFLGSKDLVDYAVKQGWYNPNSGKKFNFAEAYGSPDSMKDAYNTLREWGGLNYLKPSLKLKVEDKIPYVAERGVVNGVVPDRKISVANTMDFLRVHYEGSEMDATNGYKQGTPHWTPNRVICVNTTNSSSIVQLRSWLPAEIGHVIWRADKTPCSSVYLPWYFGITSTPVEFRTGTFRPSDASAWWIYQRIANTTDAHYGSFIGKVRTPFSKIEKELLEAQPAMESSALELYKKNPELCSAFLTHYSGGVALRALGVAREILDDLVHDTAVGEWRNP